MNKKDIKINDTLYWNTLGAFESKISLKCKVIDIGKRWIWVNVLGCLAYQNLLSTNLSKEPLCNIELLNTFEYRQKTLNYNKIVLEDVKNVEIITNLIEKLQKEADNYIPKDKVREKINELVENGYWDFLEERDLEKVIDILKELLGGD